jgi:alpha-N-arabinofuranosidase
MFSDLLQPNVVAGRVVAEPLAVEQASVAALDAVATCSDDRRRVAVALVNRHPQRPARWKLLVGGAIERMELTILSGDSPDAYNDVEHPNRVVPETREVASGDATLELPPHSVAVARWGS